MQLGPIDRTRLYLRTPAATPIFGGLCCIGFINPIGIVAGVRRQRLDLSIGSNRVGST
jgi:hypothetical protein